MSDSDRDLEAEADFWRRTAENERLAAVRQLEKYLAETKELRKTLSATRADLRTARAENRELKQKLGAVYKLVPKSLLRSAWARFGSGNRP